MDNFATIRIKKKTAQRFREYSRFVAKSHTESVDVILDFFEKNQISPHEDLGPKFERLEKIISKGINSIIAIIKNIEKTQLQPTYVMVSLLFEEYAKQKKPKPVVKTLMDHMDEMEKTEFENISKLQYDRVVSELRKVKREYLQVMEKVEPVENLFGKNYLKIDLPPSELNKIKIALKREDYY